MPQIMFAPFRIRVPQQYLVGEEDPGLKAFRRLLPPFVHIEIIKQGTTEYEDIKAHSVAFEDSENLATKIIEYMSRLIDDQMGQATKEFYTSTIGDSIKPDADGKKLGIPVIKAMIAETVKVEDGDYVDGVTKVYVIHPPQLEDELRRHLSTLPVPAMFASPSERLVSVAVGQEIRYFVVEPYKMDLTRRRSADPRWLIVHLYNPDVPAMGIRVEAQGPLTFKEPTPLLSDTEVAEKWAMGVMEDYLRKAGFDVRRVCHEPNGPKTFPDYRARLDGVLWDFEITRVLGNILEERRILDKPRDAKKNMDLAVQSPPIEDGVIENALDHAIKSKEHKRQSDGTARNLCLVLLNALGLNISRQSKVWEDRDLASFDAVVLVSGFSRPSVELIKGRLMKAASCPSVYVQSY